ncbi:ATP-grasp domain-containing protein [Rhodobacteraceae bacterium LMO-12]|nr:ATP-grasp domain-containing protein [Rhodobacteraceae bacterium LMO-JJ12]
MVFDAVLVANRGEIARRVIRSVKAAGMRAVAVYSDADAGAPHVSAADQAIRIGPGPVGESYLDVARILKAATESGAGAVHPGYGFLSENAGFARAVEAAGLVFIGPTPEAIETMGDKAAAKRAMQAAGVPCVPGYHGVDQSDAVLVAQAAKIGFPLMVKAAAGGGGKGMRRVTRPQDLVEALERARSEARGAFGSDLLILERAVLRPRHVEIQVFADGQGRCIHLGERDCSVQRRHQKIIEEAPGPAMTQALRDAMGQAGVQAAQAVGYRGAGTVEFLVDEAGAFYFLEMNTRLQVEHPVTEMITGFDLVAMQIAVAQGAPLGLKQADVTLCGHAIEARLYAEDPARDFLPVTGRIAHWKAPDAEGVRVDSGVESGMDISPYYDPMLAKIIAWGPDRESARKRLIGALKDTACLGLVTNAGFLASIAEHAEFAAGEATTAFLEEAFADGYRAPDTGSETQAVGAALILRHEMRAGLAASLLPDDQLLGFASDGGRAVPIDLMLDSGVITLSARALGADRWDVSGEGWRHIVEIESSDGVRVQLVVDGRREQVFQAPDGAGGLYLQRGAGAVHLARYRAGRKMAEERQVGVVVAPMPGQVIAIDVAVGDLVTRGQRLAVLEAMKMQHLLVAECDGVVQEVTVVKDAQVAAGQVIIVIGKEEP